MTLLLLGVRLIQQRRVVFLLTALSIAAGTALVVGILLLHTASKQAFSQKDTGYEVVVGAKGSPLQLVLHTMFHIGTPVGNISHSVADKLLSDRRVRYALPMVFGDNVQGYKVVGTTAQFFDTFEYRKSHVVSVQKGARFQQDYEAVLGSEVAAKTGLQIGNSVVMVHGMHEEGAAHEHRAIVITGILAPTHTALDRGIFTTMETVWDAHYREYREQQREAEALLEEADAESEEAEGKHHDADKGEHHHHHHAGEGGHHHHEGDSDMPASIPDDFTTITSIAVQLKSPIFFESFVRAVNEGTTAQAALPMREIAGLFAVVGNINNVLLALSWSVIVVGAFSMFIAMYTSLHERRREMAILRSLGAHRRTVFALVLVEAAATGVVGALAGVCISHLVLLLAAPYVQTAIGVPLEAGNIHGFEFTVIAGVVGIAMAVALLPAVQVYRVDVADSLAPTL